MKIWEWLKGKKSYFLAVGMAIYAVSGAATKQFTWQHAYELLAGSGALATLRHGIG